MCAIYEALLCIVYDESWCMLCIVLNCTFQETFVHSESLISEVPGRIILRDYLSLGKGFLGTVRGSGNGKKVEPERM